MSAPPSTATSVAATIASTSLAVISASVVFVVRGSFVHRVLARLVESLVEHRRRAVTGRPVELLSCHLGREVVLRHPALGCVVRIDVALAVAEALRAAVAGIAEMARHGTRLLPLDSVARRE